MKDLSMMVDENVKLNVRTTGVFLNDGKVLVHKCCETGHYALPGGRVQAREDSITALKREVSEELDLEIENISFIGAVENFFTVPEAKFHEYMWMIKGDFKDKSVYDKDVIIGHEQERELVFEWVDVDKLENLSFRPMEVIPYLKNIDGKVHHMIIR
ncbi:MAG: NUDIX domain-containing protein [Clostridia bacterium]|nr:NUDIX domain-containing protein [Clostridia bacterium]